jgi:hypothetical protein
MPDTAVAAAPFFLQRAFIQLGVSGSGTEVSCACTHLTATPDQDESTIDTMCGSYTSYKKPKWTITVSIAISYGADGAWTLIHPLCGSIVPFVLRPDEAVGSIDNPVMSGEVLLKQLPFIDAAPGEASEVDLEMKVQGEPLFGIADPVATSRASAAA